MKRSIALMTSAILVLTSTGAALAAPPSKYSATDVNFGNRTVGATYYLTTTFTNSTKRAVQLGSYYENAPLFEIDLGTGTCKTTYNLSIPANTSCTVRISFSPTATTSYTYDYMGLAVGRTVVYFTATGTGTS